MIASEPGRPVAESSGALPVVLAEEYGERLARVRSIAAQSGWDAVVCFASRTARGFVRYLCGYEPWNASNEVAYVVVPTDASIRPTLLSNSPWDDAAIRASAFASIGELVLGSDWVTSLAAALPVGVRRIGVAPLHRASYSAMSGLIVRAGISIDDATPALSGLRAVKSAHEIELLRVVAAICDLGGDTFADADLHDMNEIELAADIDATMARAGSAFLDYPTSLAGGVRTLDVCFLPSSRALRRGELIQLDCSPVVDGYRGDFARIRSDEPSPPVRRLADAVEATYEACLSALRPGATCDEVARVGCREVVRAGLTRDNLFKSANYPDLVFMGHGIGLDNPDPPGMLATGNDSVLQPGMVINLEPILCLAGVGSARIESAILITASDNEPLSVCRTHLW